MSADFAPLRDEDWPDVDVEIRAVDGSEAVSNEPIVRVGGSTVWDDVQQLCNEIGYEAVWEPMTVQPPPLVCEPMPDDDHDWPRGPYGTPMPDDMDEPTICAVHEDEWWPCRAFREGCGVVEQEPRVETGLAIRPKEKRDDDH